MIRSLRRKFIVIAMLSLLATLAILCAAVFAGNHYATAKRADRGIDYLYQNGGEFPAPVEPVNPASVNSFQITMETPFETRYFVVELTPRQEISSVDTDHIAAIDRQTVIDSVAEILASGKDRGYLDYYRFGVFHGENGGSTVIVMDCFLQLQSTFRMLRITLLVAFACALLVLVLLMLLSRRAIRPFVENLEKQRQFVTDASHELKTPLTILSADLSLMQDSPEENHPWLESAKAQVTRLDKLIQGLVELARTEENVKEDIVSSFNISEAAQACADAFLPLAEAAGKTLKTEIAPDIRVEGVEENLVRLFTILLDNAVKYCDGGGIIRLTLSQRGRAVFAEVSNPCAGVDATRLSRWFDRFYRADSSRARATGSYGIGLSTAKAIVSRHGGKISAGYERGVVSFSVTVPLTMKKRTGRRRKQG